MRIYLADKSSGRVPHPSLMAFPQSEPAPVRWMHRADQIRSYPSSMPVSDAWMEGAMAGHPQYNSFES
jgi:hypothetical protein